MTSAMLRAITGVVSSCASGGGVPRRTFLFAGAISDELLSVFPQEVFSERWVAGNAGGRENVISPQPIVLLSGEFREVIHKLPDYYFDLIYVPEESEAWVRPVVSLSKLKVKLNAEGRIVCVGINLRFRGVLRSLLLDKPLPHGICDYRGETGLYGTIHSFRSLLEDAGYVIQETFPVFQEDPPEINDLPAIQFGNPDEIETSHYLFSAVPENVKYSFLQQKEFEEYIASRFPVVMSHFKKGEYAEARSITADTIDILKRSKKSGLEALLEKFESLSIKLATLRPKKQF